MLDLMLTGGSGVGRFRIDKHFNALVYTGTGAARTLTTGVDVTGGLLITKRRNASGEFRCYRESGSYWVPSSTAVETSADSSGVTGITATGFEIGGGSAAVNASGGSYVAYSFAPHPKFFSRLVYTGNGSNRTLNSGLETDVGAVIIKRLAGGNHQGVFRHTDMSTNSRIEINSTGVPALDSDSFKTISGANVSIGSAQRVNANGGSYVAYFFADDEHCRCGSFTVDGSNVAVDCGFMGSARWVLIKCITVNGNFMIFDEARGINTGNDPTLAFNTTNAETSANYINPMPGGFIATTGLSGTYVYIAIG